MRYQFSTVILCTAMLLFTLASVSCKKSSEKDTTKPTVTFISPTEGQVVDMSVANLPVSVSATDETGLNIISVDLTSANFSSTDEKTNLSGLKAYVYDFTEIVPLFSGNTSVTAVATVTDLSGNTATATVHFTAHY